LNGCFVLGPGEERRDGDVENIFQSIHHIERMFLEAKNQHHVPPASLENKFEEEISQNFILFI
jgi:hypothetical protein